MKTFLKIIGGLIGVVVILVIAFVLFINIRGIPSYENNAPELTVEVTPERVAEGARIASMLCANCHRSKDGKLGGGYMADAAEFGEIYSANITQHPQYGITEYSDGELMYLFRTGILKDGRYSPPYMPKWPHASDEDLESIIAFLKSDHPWVQPSDNQPPQPEPAFITKLLTNVAFKPYPYPENPIYSPDTADLVAFGKYCATAIYDCYQCHSADFKTNDGLEPANSVGFFGGGNRMTNLEGETLYATNLTMHETGLGKWTVDEFKRAVREGIGQDGQALGYPMTPFTQMKDIELEAMWEYLKTIPEIDNDVTAMQ